MGYRNVEPFTLSGLTAEQYRALLDEYGLKASARHVDVGTPENPADIEQILADNRTLGIQYFGSGSTPIFGPTAYTTEAAVDRLRRVPRTSSAPWPASRARQLMVHNHDIEFEMVFGDQTVFDILMAHTDPKNVVFQLDLYWATNGGGVANPLDVIEQYGNRIKLFHVKDMAAGTFPGRIEIVGRGHHRLPGDLRGRRRQHEVLRRRARPALRRPDVRPVRGGPEGLRLPRLRDVLSHSRGGVAVGPPRRAFVPCSTSKEDHVRTSTSAGSPGRGPRRGIRHSLGRALGPSAPPPDSAFQKVVIDATPGEPIDLAVLPDGSVLHTDRNGEVWLHDADTGLKTLAAKLDVYSP